MKQKILSTVVGVVLAGSLSVAAADVVLFGHLDTSYVYYDQDGGDDGDVFQCTTCSIGFKGSEDLGNGLKAIFYLDFQYDIFNQNSDYPDSITDRDQWLGLANSFGQVRWGTISTPYKSHGAMIDPLYRTSLQGRDRGLQSDFHNGAGENLQGRADNTIRYDTPDWNGLKASAFYTLDSNENDGYGGTENNDPYGVGVEYSRGGLLGFADWEDNNGDKNDVGGDISVWKVGGKYMLSAGAIDFGFYGQYESSSIDEDSPANIVDVDYKVWQLAASAQLGNTMAYFGYGHGSYDFNAGQNEDYNAWTLALMHSLSKRTKIYAGFSEVDCDARIYVNTWGAPPTMGLPSSACGDIDYVDTSTHGGEDDKFTIGMKHTF